MESTQEELKAHLMQTDEEFRRLSEDTTATTNSWKRWRPKRTSLPRGSGGASAEENQTSVERSDEPNHQPLSDPTRPKHWVREFKTIK
jgi:hypothetical protein